MALVHNGDLVWDDLPLIPKPGVFLWCPTCRAEASAKRSHYHMIDPEATIRCAEDGCKGYMRLAERITRIQILDPSEAGDFPSEVT
jgi:hypothetical protein